MRYSTGPRLSTMVNSAAAPFLGNARALARAVAIVFAGALATAVSSVFASAVPAFQNLKTFSSVGGAPIADLIQAPAPDGSFYGTAYLDGGFGGVIRITPNGTGGFTTTIIHSFNGTDGDRPRGPMVQGPDGALYGTTSWGGNSNQGTVFKVNPDGSGFATLYSFPGPPGGMSPWGGLVLGVDGNFYGMTVWGGPDNGGTIFKISGDGLSFTTLHVFNGTDGSTPMSGLIRASDGNFYGTTQVGGEYLKGTVFKMSADGQTVTVIHSFDAGGPWAGLIEGSDGRLYGTTFDGFDSIFALSKDGSGFATLHTFTGEGTDPRGSLIQADDGNLYGTTHAGGSSGAGSVFRLALDPLEFTTLYSFTGNEDGAYLYAGLIQGLDGKLYGTAQNAGHFLGGTVFQIALDGSELHVISAFPGSVYPVGSLIRGSDGWLYGTTSDGDYGATAMGAVFKMKADGTAYSVLHAFRGADGAEPVAGLVLGLDGYYYGTTAAGGSSGNGTVFRISADGTDFTTIHFFGAHEGAAPASALVQAADGTFYGTTRLGGATGMSYGTVFSLGTADGGETWNFSTLHSFAGSDGAFPIAGLVLDADAGLLYGVTNLSNSGGGVIYKISVSGSFSVLHDLASNEGSNAEGTLFLDETGTLYGTAMYGAAGYGTVFSIPSGGGDLTVLHSFLSDVGGYPRGGVILGSDGKLYGTTADGSGWGTVFTLTPDGDNFSFLHTFVSDDGASPRATLLWGGDGYVYGTTKFGGPIGDGMAFRLRVTTASLPAVSVAADGPTTFCAGGGVGLTATPSGGAGSYLGYQWYKDAVPIDGVTMSTYSAVESGSYTVTVTDTGLSTSDPSEAVTVTVNPLPEATITPGGPTTFACGGSVVLTASAGSSWVWSTGETTQSIMVSSGGDYTVTVADENGCPATSEATVVTVERPVATVSGGGGICPRSPRTIEAQLGGTPPWNLTWSDGYVQNGVTSSPATRDVSPRRETTYTLISFSDASCEGTFEGSATVTPSEAPKAVLKGSTTVCPGGEAMLSVTLTGTAPWSITWSDGATENDITVSPHVRTVTPGETTVYSLTAVSDASCSGTTRGSARIRVSTRCP